MMEHVAIAGFFDGNDRVEETGSDYMKVETCHIRSVRVLSVLKDEVLSVDGGAATGGGSDDCLLVGGVGHVAGGEDAGDVGGSRRSVGFDEAGFIGDERAIEEVGAWFVADSKEEAVDCDVEVAFVGSAAVFYQVSAFEVFVAEEAFGVGVEEDFDFGMV